MAGPAPRAIQDRPLAGIMLILLSYLAFSFVDTGSKWLSVAGLPALQLSFMRYAGHFAISSGQILAGGVSKASFACKKPFLVILRGVCLAASTALNFIALQYLPLTLTATIFFSAPIIISALSWPLLGERVGAFRWGAIALGFFGVLIAIRPFDEDFHWAVLLSIGNAVAFALYSILTRKLSGVVATQTLQFYSGLVGAAGLLPFAVLEWQQPGSALHWAILLSMGFFGWAGHQILTTALSFAPPNLLMPFGYSFILYLTAWSFLLFGHVPDPWTIAGAAVIISAGLIIWLRESKLYRLRRISDQPASESLAER